MELHYLCLMFKITGKKINLRPAKPYDKRKIYEWLACSNLTGRMMGPPNFPDHPIPSWEEFQDDYHDYFFNGSQPERGRCFVIELEDASIGQINHDKIYTETKSTELDIWLADKKYTGQGYGTEAIILLGDYLHSNFDCLKFIIAPSKRNKIAIRSYQKAGFEIVPHQGPIENADYTDIILMTKEI